MSGLQSEFWAAATARREQSCKEQGKRDVNGSRRPAFRGSISLLELVVG